MPLSGNQINVEFIQLKKNGIVSTGTNCEIFNCQLRNISQSGTV